MYEDLGSDKSCAPAFVTLSSTYLHSAPFEYIVHLIEDASPTLNCYHCIFKTAINIILNHCRF